jgi:uncharacterized protein YlbG (UPF0298 family)
MARSRNIKPAFFENELLGELPPLDRLAFIAMWTIDDFKGCFEYRPKRLKLKLLPYDDCDIEKIVGRLEQSGFLKKYSIAENDYIKIINFSVHQNPHIKEKTAGSKIPDIDVMNKPVLAPNKNETNHADSLLLIPDSLKPHPDTLKKIGNGLIFGSIDDLDIQPFDMSNVMNIEDLILIQDFEIFWTNYPKKTKKEDAKIAWLQTKPDLSIVLQALKWQKETKEWFREEGQYIPNAKNYILDHRWTDEPPEPITF